MKKNWILSAVWVLLMLSGYAQNVAINTDASLPNVNAMLDIKSGNKGLLIPRMSSAARNAIPNTRGLLVYDTTTDNFWYNTGSKWMSIATADVKAALVATGPWLLTGNSGTSDSANFLGTTDNVPLNFRVNNLRAGRLDATAANSFFGVRAGASNTTGAFNTAMGAKALYSNTTSTYNTASGYQSLYSNNTGTNNTGYGVNTLYSTTSGSGNTASGVNALYSNTIGIDNAANGLGCLYFNVSGNSNTASGVKALYNNTIGNNNTANGWKALYNNTTASGLTATGYQSMYSNVAGGGNTANGYMALYSNQSGGDNTAVGYQALYSNGTGRNTVTGFQAMFANVTGAQNTAQGWHALVANTSGSENVAIGTGAMLNNTAGASNAALGTGAMNDNTIGFGNIAIGQYAMLHNTTGGYNTAIGYYADVSNGSLSNATAVGNGAIVDASNKVRIGNSAVTVIEGQVPFTTPSDGRYKFNVQEDVRGLNFILQLRPVTYQFDVKRFDAGLRHQDGNEAGAANYAIQTAYDEASRIRRSGFIAQEVEVAARTTGYDFSGIIRPKTEQDHYSLSYDAFVVPLVKAIQEQQQIIAAQKRKMEEQDKRIDRLEQQLEELTKLVRSSR